MLISKRVFRMVSAVIFGMSISGCTQFPDNSDLFSNQTLTTEFSSITFTPEPSPTLEFTATQTVKPTSTPTPTPDIPTNPGYFEGVGEISEIELRMGKWYGIDKVGRAEIVYNNGEWVKYDRPIFGANFDDYGYKLDGWAEYSYDLNTEGLILDEVPASEIKTLTNADGESIKWGFQAGTTIWFVDNLYKGGTFSGGETDNLPSDVTDWHSQYAGYFIGTITGDITYHLISDSGESQGTKYGILFYVFEIPNRYTRQIILITLPSGEYDRQFDVQFSDVVGSEDIRTYLMQSIDVGQLITSKIETLRGSQCIIDMRFNSVWSDPKLWDYLKNNKAYNILRHINLAENLFFSSSLNQ